MKNQPLNTINSRLADRYGLEDDTETPAPAVPNCTTPYRLVRVVGSRKPTRTPPNRLAVVYSPDGMRRSERLEVEA